MKKQALKHPCEICGKEKATRQIRVKEEFVIEDMVPTGNFAAIQRWFNRLIYKIKTLVRKESVL